MMLFYLMLGLVPHGLDLGFLGLGLLGLGLGLGAWASSFAKTNKKNFKCFGPCPFLLLITSFLFSSLSQTSKAYFKRLRHSKRLKVQLKRLKAHLSAFKTSKAFKAFKVL